MSAPRRSGWGLARAAVAGALAVAFLLALPGARARAASVLLRNGEKIEGQIIDVTAADISVEVDTRRSGKVKIRVPLHEIDRVVLRESEKLRWSAAIEEALGRAREAEPPAPPTPTSPRPPTPTPPTPTPPTPTPPAPTPRGPEIEAHLRFKNDRYGYAFKYPARLRVDSSDPAVVTFRDPPPAGGGTGGPPGLRVAAVGFLAVETTYDEARTMGKHEADRVRGFVLVGRDELKVAGRAAERLVGVVLDFTGSRTRLDQIVVDGPKGPVVIQFFSPASGVVEGAGPVEVERAIGSLEFE